MQKKQENYLNKVTIVPSLWQEHSPEKNAELYGLIQEMAEEFKKENGSIICRELLAGITDDSSPTPEPRTEQYYRSRPCARFAEAAAGILERKIAEQKD